MRGPKLSDERGIALAVAVLALVVIGALVAGTFFAGRLEQRGGQNTVYSAQAFEAAEAGVIATITGWDPNVHGAGAVGADVALPLTSLGGQASYTPTVTKLNSSLFLIRSRGERATPGGNILARRLLGSLVRLKIPEIDIQAAVTAHGGVRVGGNALVDGNDHIPGAPANWGGVCPPLEAPMAGIRTDGAIQQSGNPTIMGNPPRRQNDATVVDSIFTEPFDALAAMRDIEILVENPTATAPATTGLPLRCDRTNTLNWGEPWFPAVPATASVCQTYFPIIYRHGNLKLQGGRGQGILLVKGNLELAGGVEFFGIVMVDGRMSTNGNGNKVNGAIMARNVDLDENFLGGTPTANYSACAISRALNASATVIPLAKRSWAQLY